MLEGQVSVLSSGYLSAQESLIQGASIERGTIVTTIETYFLEMLQKANAKFQGKFLFQ